MDNPFGGIIRASAFIRKEIFDVIRQPRLVITLILGPFLILFIFGLGYHNEARPLRTLFVAQPGSAIAQNIQEFQKLVSATLVYSGMTSDQNDALNRLRLGEVDLVIVAPKDPYNTILSNQQAVFTVYYGEIDPIQVSYIQYVGEFYADTINRQVLSAITGRAQKSMGNLHNELQQIHQNIAALRQAEQAGNAGAVRQTQQSLTENLDTVSQAMGASLGFLTSLDQSSDAQGGSSDSLQTTLQDIQQNEAQLNNNDPSTPAQRLDRLDRIDRDITTLDRSVGEFQNISPSIMINPFRSEAQSVASIQPSESDFFTPAVLALLLQHLAVTFAALSIVKERSSGTMELFRVSPLSAGEALLGKYASYLLFGWFIAAGLSLLLIFGLHLPMIGNWLYVALVITAVLFASLGFGFLISILSQTDSQAVQLSMILLLASVFFGGFLINLDFLRVPVKVISWMLPTTYGTAMLRDIMLRGLPPDWLLLAGLGAIGLALMVISRLLLGRLTSRSR